MAAELDALTFRVNTLQESYRKISTQYDRTPTKSLSVQPVPESYSGSPSRSLPKVSKARYPQAPSTRVGRRVGSGYYLGFSGGVYMPSNGGINTSGRYIPMEYKDGPAYSLEFGRNFGNLGLGLRLVHARSELNPSSWAAFIATHAPLGVVGGTIPIPDEPGNASLWSGTLELSLQKEFFSRLAGSFGLGVGYSYSELNDLPYLQDMHANRMAYELSADLLLRLSDNWVTYLSWKYFTPLEGKEFDKLDGNIVEAGFRLTM